MYRNKHGARNSTILCHEDHIKTNVCRYHMTTYEDPFRFSNSRRKGKAPCPPSHKFTTYLLPPPPFHTHGQSPNPAVVVLFLISNAYALSR